MVEIIAYQKGQKGMNKFREFYPFDFRLLNENDEHGFYIQDTNESIRLSIFNKTDKSIEFKKIPEKDFGINNFHFMLRFRPGVLAGPDKIRLKDDGAWSLTTENQNGLQLLCFRIKTQEENDLSEVKNLDIQLNNLLADSSLGSRDSNVELHCDNIVLGDSKEVLRASRQVKWPIISHRGNPRIPIHVGIVGSNTILNNGEPNTLTLRVSLINPKKESLKFKHDLNDSVRSKIIITFDTGDENDEWAISESADHFKYKSKKYSDLLYGALRQAQKEYWKAEDHFNEIKKKDSPFFLRMMSDQEKSNYPKLLAEANQRNTKAKEFFDEIQNLRGTAGDEEIFEFQLNKQTEPAEMVCIPSEMDILMGNTGEAITSATVKIPSFFDITISEIKTKYPSGKTNCYIRFENIPGYWDHTFVCPIQKQPLVIKENRVGIGKAPSAPLDVKGNAVINGELDIKENVNIDGKVVGSLTVQTDGTAFQINSTDGSPKFHTRTSPETGSSLGQVSIGATDNDKLTLFAGEEEERGFATLLPNGNFGIGTNTPAEAKLVVEGDLRAKIIKADALQIGSTVLKERDLSFLIARIEASMAFEFEFEIDKSFVQANHYPDLVIKKVVTIETGLTSIPFQYAEVVDKGDPASEWWGIGFNVYKDGTDYWFQSFFWLGGPPPAKDLTKDHHMESKYQVIGEPMLFSKNESKTSTATVGEYPWLWSKCTSKLY